MQRALSLALIVATFALSGCTADIVYREDLANPRNAWSGDDFVRYNGYDNVAGTMQASAVTYKHPDHAAQLTLVGAVHVGDREYYQDVQKRLDAADLVLFELVKPANMDVRQMNLRGQRGMYSGIADLFGLAEQMQEIDYQRDHFQWLDMSAEVFQARLQTIIQKAVERLGGEMQAQSLSAVDRLALLKDALLEAPRELQLQFVRLGLNIYRFQDPGAQPQDPIQMVLELALTPLRWEKEFYRNFRDEQLFEDKYQHAMALGLGDPSQQSAQMEQLKGQGGVTGVLVDALMELQQVILEERNDIVVEGIKDLFESGKAPANVVVWYGAGHYPGVDEDLRAYGFQPVGEPEWIDCMAIEK